MIQKDKYGRGSAAANGEGFVDLAPGDTFAALEAQLKRRIADRFDNAVLGMSASIGSKRNASELAKHLASGEEEEVHKFAAKNVGVLFARGRLGISHDDKKAVGGQRWITRFVRVFVPFRFAGGGYLATLTLKDVDPDKRIYAVEAVEINQDAKPGSTPRGAISEDLNSAPFQDLTSQLADMISYYVGDVNRTHPKFVGRDEMFSTERTVGLLEGIMQDFYAKHQAPSTKRQAPQFSIIIPVYNVAPYLRECLDSVLAQTFTDWEAICVDDGSTDDSGAILDEYAAKDSRFRIIHQTNAGVSAARNAALDVARGEWLEFIDADDSIVSEALSRFDSIANKADVVFFGSVMILRDGSRRAYILPDWTIRAVEESTSVQISSLAFSTLGDVFGWTWDKIIRRDVVERFHIRFDRAISFFEDELFALEVMNVAESFATLPDCLYRYRQTAGGLTAHGGGSDWEVLGKSFVRVGAKLKNSGLRKIAFSRAQTWLRLSAYRGFRPKSARSLILLYRMASDVIGTDGSYNKLMRVLCRFPVWLAKFLLAGFHMFHK